MNFRKSSKRLLTPPLIFGKLHCAFRDKIVTKVRMFIWRNICVFYDPISPKKSLPLFSSRPRSIGLVLPRMTVEREKTNIPESFPRNDLRTKIFAFLRFVIVSIVLSSFETWTSQNNQKTSFQARSPTLT